MLEAAVALQGAARSDPPCKLSSHAGSKVRVALMFPVIEMLKRYAGQSTDIQQQIVHMPEVRQWWVHAGPHSLLVGVLVGGTRGWARCMPEVVWASI